ncbi:iron ABC transporter ATP-binding protein [Sulfurovum lithotrophicum]|uniref:Iron ABC transporter ATP-binding protein n=1 Tax=Sulfurovum lithotrophicum TaxID=206403 RepID=A0A7U4RQT4_9BACT|nr:ABC transporter ATP-binding protein [Sulfurovum lithotrophicum]AKF25140.1 iron ABC transporter ATP-binding protein [Sulfurovum lithotrophicum]
MIKIRNLSFMYENRTILNKIDLSVKANERLVLLGSSGSGKSTLLKLIAGFIAPDSGDIVIGSKVVSKEGSVIVPPHRRAISMVFQDLALWPHMNVGENIAFGLKMHKVPPKERAEKVKAFLALVGLPAYEKKKTEALSGGEQQRVALARALVLSPKVVLMDEPLSSLDEALNIRLRQEIITLQEKLGFTLVYVTHNREEGQQIAQRIVEIQNGRIVERSVF